MFNKLVPYLRNYKTAAILCPLLMLFEVFGDILMPLMMAHIVDEGISQRNTQIITHTGIGMIVLAMFALACGAYASRLAAVASIGAGAEIRNDLFQRIQSFSFANLDRYSIPSLITRLTSDINNIQQIIMMSLRIMVRAPFMMVLALIMTLWINAKLATVFLIAIPVMSISLVSIMTKAHPRFRAVQAKIDLLNTSVQENLINIRVVKSFVRTDFEEEKFKTSNDSLMNTALHALRLVIVIMPIMQLIMFGCIVAILWFGGQMVTAGSMKTGQLISFISYVTQILMSLMILSMVFLMLTRAKASAERVVEVLDTQPDIVDPENAITEVPDGSIEFREVHFRYASGTGDETLSSVTLRIEPGETIGIIGSTGSAKTTLVQLIPRLYDVTAGAVLVGGHDVREYSIGPLRDSVAMVLQNNTLFSGTVRENLLWGNPEATEQHIQQACESAQAWGFINELANGLDTTLEQGGVNLSGGQRQRLCIARALLKQPRIIILDDSTSAVDMATDSRIRDSFTTRLAHVTTLIIAQRIVSISHADRVIVMDNGTVNGFGSHEQLLESNEIYRDVYQSQQEGALAG